MKKSTVFLVFLAVGLLGGCAVVPTMDGGLAFQPVPFQPVVVAPQAVYAPQVAYAQPYVQPDVVAQPGFVDGEIDYVGEGTPLAFAAYPGVAFYPRYVEECFCIYNVGYVGGRWINHLGAPVVYHGHWGVPPAHIRDAHRNYIRQNPHMFTRMHEPGRLGGHAVGRPGQEHPGPQRFGGQPQQHPGPGQQQHFGQQQRPGQPQQHFGQQQRPVQQARPMMQPRPAQQVHAAAPARAAPAPRAAAPARAPAARAAPAKK